MGESQSHSLSTVSGDETSNILLSIEQLSRLRSSLKPRELTPEVFPPDLDVLKFDPYGKFEIRSHMPMAMRIFWGLFCLPHYILFLGLIGVILFRSSLVGGIVGVLLWIWRNYLGSYVSINQTAKKYSLFMPAAVSWYNNSPEIKIQSIFKGNKWITTLLIANQVVVERQSDTKIDYKDLEEFTRSLKWRLGDIIEIAEGVFISP
jgi:hypothetical protein